LRRSFSQRCYLRVLVEMKPERWELIDDMNKFLRYSAHLYDIDDRDFNRDINKRYSLTLEELRQLHQKVELYRLIQKASE
jgi:hypothetical protein